MASISWPILLTIVISLLLGALLVRRGRRGRRLHDHPVCAKCGYDLFGRPEKAARCPECGGDLSNAKAVRVGAYQKRWGLILAGCFVWMIGGAVAGIAVFERHHNVDWCRYKPVWWLAWEAERTGHVADNQAFDELNRRIRAGELSHAQTQDLISRALRIQADHSLSWNEGWNRILDEVYTSGLLKPSDVDVYTRESIHSQIEVHVRKKIVIGEPIPVQIAMKQGVRGFPLESLHVHLNCDHRIAIGDYIFCEAQSSPLEEIALSLGHFYGRCGNAVWGYRPVVVEFSIAYPNSVVREIRPGTTQARFELNVQATDVTLVTDTSVASYNAIHSFLQEVTWLAPGTDSVSLELRPEFRPVLRLEVLHTWDESKGNFLTELVAVFFSSKSDIAFDVDLLENGVAHRVGTLAGRKDEISTYRSVAKLQPPERIAMIAGESVVLRLTPNTKLARMTADIETIWGETIELTNVPVKLQANSTDHYLEEL